MWKDIKGYEGYQVSDDGRVRTHNKVTHTDRHGDRHWKDRILAFKRAVHGKSRGDAMVDLWKDGKPRTLKVSRLVAFTFLGGDFNDTTLTVNHKDGDFRNNRIENLELISLADNIRHGFDNGLYPSCVKTIVTNKETGESVVYRSMSAASRAIGKDERYISAKLKKGITENEHFEFRRAS